MKEFNLPYFIYVGNAYPHKNLEKAVRAFVNQNKTLTQKVQFLIISKENSFTKKLDKLIEKLEASEYVKIIGFVEDKEINELYKKSIGFIYPSLSEGFGLPGLEAMKAGTIVLASDIPVFREIYGGYVIYFDPNDQKSIEKAIKETFEMGAVEARKRIFKAREFIQRYSWEKMARETLEVYKNAS